MFPKQEVVAMLLAGGQGSRLGVLTRKIAKPAVPYGGKYRIIDFPLSNCANSGIDAVGVLTQYQPLVLNEYIGNGRYWDLDSMNGGVQVLSPYQRIRGADWYKGTANAIYQNMDYIERFDPDYVIILSGDHIYKMNYSKMISYHKANKADCSIAVIDVPISEASRFGILNTNPDNTIYEFEEKPKVPKSTKASMGIYVFNWGKLKEYLIEDANDSKSSNDFGKDIIPKMLKSGEKMVAYNFSGYWKDVGTIESLWKANIDLLDPKVALDLSDESWKIYSNNPVMPPQYIADGARVQNSLVADGCNIYGAVNLSIIFAGVYIGRGAVIKDSIIMPGVRVEDGAVIKYTIVSENTVIGKNAIIGEENIKEKGEWGITVIGDNLNIGPDVKILPKQMIDRNIPEVI